MTTPNETITKLREEIEAQLAANRQARGRDWTVPALFAVAAFGVLNITIELTQALAAL